MTAIAAGVTRRDSRRLSDGRRPDISQAFDDLSRKPWDSREAEIIGNLPAFLSALTLDCLFLALQIALVLEGCLQARDVDLPAGFI